MDSPEKILYRLEELRKWQKIQEEKLLQRQTFERQKLTNDQEKLYEKLNSSNSLVINEINVQKDSKKDIEDECIDKCSSEDINKSIKDDDQNCIKNIDPINCDNNVNIDDIPIKPCSNNFNVLLEKKLNEGNKNEMNIDYKAKQNVKPYLKKGQGLVRYKMTQNKPKYKKPILKNKSDTPKLDIISDNQNDKVDIIDDNTKQTWCNILIKNDDKLQSSKKHNYTDLSLTNSPSLSKLSLEKENAEQRMFELIERKVSNESFSSTNSFVNKIVNSHSTTVNNYRKLVELRQLVCDVNSDSDIECKLILNSEKSDNNNWEDIETSESSSTEETCKMVMGNHIMTSTPYDGSKRKNEIKDNTNFCTESQSQIFKNDCSNNTVVNSNNDKVDIISIKDMFKNRLMELEKEIEIFQSENNSLIKLKEMLSKEKEDFLKEKANLEAKLNEDKIINEYHLAEEREKLHKMKLLYDKNMKEMKMISSKKDREEINNLRKELEELREQMAMKDARNGACLSRLRNQLKNLEKDKKELNEECDKLKKENAKLKSINSRTQRLKNIKLLSDIGKSITDNVSDVEIEDVPPKKQSFKNKNKENIKPIVIKHTRLRTRSEPNLTKKQSLEKDTNLTHIGYGLDSDNESDESIHKIDNRNMSPDIKINSSIENIYFNKFNTSKENVDLENNSSIIKNTSQSEQTNNNDNSPKKIEKVNPDGSIEISFPNGNHKILSADGSYTKFTFFNGDVKEIYHNEGTIKYYYKEMNVHQTSYKDGSEILHFPDGYIERRYPDGSIKAHLANGTIRWMKPNSCEEWQFPDGTLVLVNAEGEQTLRFPNGQTEIHTADYKKREFPDGTVKIIYSDGMSETKYSSGRIRVKDKYGNLVMDSAKSHHNTKH